MGAVEGFQFVTEDRHEGVVKHILSPCEHLSPVTGVIPDGANDQLGGVAEELSVGLFHPLHRLESASAVDVHASLCLHCPCQYSFVVLLD